MPPAHLSPRPFPASPSRPIDSILSLWTCGWSPEATATAPRSLGLSLGNVECTAEHERRRALIGLRWIRDYYLASFYTEPGFTQLRESLSLIPIPTSGQSLDMFVGPLSAYARVLPESCHTYAASGSGKDLLARMFGLDELKLHSCLMPLATYDGGGLDVGGIGRIVEIINVVHVTQFWFYFHIGARPQPGFFGRFRKWGDRADFPDVMRAIAMEFLPALQKSAILAAQEMIEVRC